MRIFCLSQIRLISVYLDFGVLDGQNRLFKDVTLGSGKLFSNIFKQGINQLIVNNNQPGNL